MDLDLVDFEFDVFVRVAIQDASVAQCVFKALCASVAVDFIEESSAIARNDDARARWATRLIFNLPQWFLDKRVLRLGIL